MSNPLISTVGLCADAFGAGLLGFDLIRLQHRIRREAADRQTMLEGVAEQYGGVAAWAADIKKQARWVPSSAYEDYHAEDVISYNTRNLADRAEELGDCVNGLGEHVARITEYLGEAAKSDTTTSAISIRYSIVGLALLFFGFVLQTLGTIV